MQQMKLLLFVLLWATETVAFSVAPFGVAVQNRAGRSSSLSCPPKRESLRVSPTMSSWFQWGTEPKKEATTSAAEEVTSAAPAAAAPAAAVVAEVTTQEAAAPVTVVAADATAATEEIPATTDAIVEEVAAVAPAAAAEANGVEPSEAAPSQKQPRGPRKLPVKRDRHTVFVGNLPFDVNDKDLRDLISAHAKVEFVSIPRNRETGQARGFAFVDVSSAEEVQAVIDNVGGVQFGGRSLRVSESLTKDDGAGKGGAPQQQQQQQPSKKKYDEGVKKIYVGNLPFDTDKEELIEYYSQWGAVKDVYVPINPDSGEARGFAFVSMDDENANTAIAESNGMLYRGRKLAVSIPLPPGEKTVRPPREQQSQRLKLYVGNLSFYTVADTLRELFEQYGKVYDCYMPEDPSTGGSRGFGFITMDAEDAPRAIAEADGIEVDGRLIRVNEAQAKRSSANINYDNDD